MHQGIKADESPFAPQKTQEKAAQSILHQKRRGTSINPIGETQKNFLKYPATFETKGRITGRASHASIPRVAPYRHCGSNGGSGGGFVLTDPSGSSFSSLEGTRGSEDPAEVLVEVASRDEGVATASGGGGTTEACAIS